MDVCGVTIILLCGKILSFLIDVHFTYDDNNNNDNNKGKYGQKVT